MALHCSVFLGASLDGFIARKDGSLDWLKPFDESGENYGFDEFFASVDTVLLGRKTYDVVLGFEKWFYAGKRCVVATHRPAASRHGEAFMAGSPGELLTQLEATGSTRVYVDGGSLVSQFLGAGLIDALTISVAPILLGEGTPVTPNIGKDVRLDLREQRAFKSGMVQLRYAIVK